MSVTYSQVEESLTKVSMYPSVVKTIQDLWTELEAYRTNDENEQWGREHSHVDGESLSEFVDKNREE